MKTLVRTSLVLTTNEKAPKKLSSRLALFGTFVPGCGNTSGDLPCFSTRSSIMNLAEAHASRTVCATLKDIILSIGTRRGAPSVTLMIQVIRIESAGTGDTRRLPNFAERPISESGARYRV